MRLRNAIIYLFILCYAGALAHALVPHHHDESAEELQEHIHSDSDHSHQSNSTDSNPGPKESPHFLTHLSNVDVLPQSNSINSFVKKEVKKVCAVKPSVKTTACSFERPVFRPPTDQQVKNNFQFRFRALRAPPVLST